MDVVGRCGVFVLLVSRDRLPACLSDNIHGLGFWCRGFFGGVYLFPSS